MYGCILRIVTISIGYSPATFGGTLLSSVDSNLEVFSHNPADGSIGSMSSNLFPLICQPPLSLFQWMFFQLWSLLDFLCVAPFASSASAPSARLFLQLWLFFI